VQGTSTADVARVNELLRRQAEDPEDHDRSLIAERLGWTPEQRLAAHSAFLRFYFRVRPQGPLIR
jgi:hypothetical protein